MLNEFSTWVHDITYGTTFPMRQLWGVRQVSDQTDEEITQNKQFDINKLEDSIIQGTADITAAITTLQAMKLQSEESQRNYQLALQSSATTLEIQKYQLLLKQEEVNLAEINRVIELAEIARKEKTTKYIVYGGVALAGILTVALLVTKRK